MKREHAFWLLMLFGVVAISFAAAEIFVRVWVDDGMQFDLEMWKYARSLKQAAPDPLIDFEHRPNGRAFLMGVDITINSKGLRDREIPYARTPGVLRVLMLGDSFTEGWGVALDDTFAKRIEGLFAATGVRAEVINAGVGNYNTIMEVNYFLDEGHKYQPDIVVLNTTFNDAEPLPPHSSENPLLGFCYSCVFLAGRFDALMRNVSLRADWKSYYLDLYDDGTTPGWLAAKAAMGQLADYTRAHDEKLLVVSFPELHQLKPYPLQHITDLVHQEADQIGAEFIDLLPALSAEPPLSLWVSPGDPHPNARANELIGAVLFHKLEAMQ